MKLEQAVRQALEALREYRDTQMISAPRRAIDSLLLALDEQTGQSQLADASLDPVAWKRESDGALFSFEVYDGLTPLYAAPVRTKDLTDEEILPDGYSVVTTYDGLLEFARAVIAADREKNK